MPASTSQRRTKPKVRRNSDVIVVHDNLSKIDVAVSTLAQLHCLVYSYWVSHIRQA